MKLTIVAAADGIGRQLLGQAVAAGHEVTAVVREPVDLGPGVRAVTTDLAAPDPAVLRTAVEGADAVLSAFIAKSAPHADVTSSGTRFLLDAMQSAGVRRIVAVSSAPVSTTPSPGRPNPPERDPGESFAKRFIGTPMAHRFHGRHLVDLALMEDLLRTSGLDWTVVRPPRLTDKPATGTYRTAFEQNLKNGRQVSRGDVAHFMLGVLDDPGTVGQAIGIAN